MKTTLKDYIDRQGNIVCTLHMDASVMNRDNECTECLDDAHEATFYCDLNGRIACTDHVGIEASAKLSGGKRPRTIRTSLTQWEKMSEKEMTEFSELVGLDHTICESCRYAK
jgi:hypothetical protein